MKDINFAIIQKLSDYEKQMSERAESIISAKKVSRVALYNCYMMSYYVRWFFDNLTVKSLWEKDSELLNLYENTVNRFKNFEEYAATYCKSYSYNEDEWKTTEDKEIKDFGTQYNLCIAYLSSLQGAIFTHISEEE